MPRCEVCGKPVDVDADEGMHYSCAGLEEPRSEHGDCEPQDCIHGSPRCPASPSEGGTGQ